MSDYTYQENDLKIEAGCRSPFASCRSLHLTGLGHA